jgi:hypothetical protein
MTCALEPSDGASSPEHEGMYHRVATGSGDLYNVYNACRRRTKSIMIMVRRQEVNGARVIFCLVPVSRKLRMLLSPGTVKAHGIQFLQSVIVGTRC